MYLFELQRQRRRCFAVEIAAAPPLFYGGYRVDIEESGNDFYPFKLPENKCAGGGFPGGRGPTGRGGGGAHRRAARARGPDATHAG